MREHKGASYGTMGQMFGNIGHPLNYEARLRSDVGPKRPATRRHMRFIGLFLFAFRTARAQDSPNRTVHHRAPRGPVAMYSIRARLTAASSSGFCQSFVIENGGRSFDSGAVFVAHAAPDGYSS